MKKLLLRLLPLLLLSAASFAQSDNCSTATVIVPAANCSAPTNGTTIGATASFPGCSGTADDDVWYKFVATSTSHLITVTPSATMDPVVELFSGTCASLINLYCMDLGIDGEAEQINATGLTIGVTYTIRVYHYYVGSGSGTFTICLTTTPPAPANNICGGAVNLTVNLACSNTAGTTLGANQSYPGCSGTADDDVWYKFQATNTTATITVDPSSNMDAVVELYSGTCGTLNSIKCRDIGYRNDNEVLNAVGLVTGNIYFVRVYDYWGSNGGYPFNICVTGPNTSAIPSNNEPCNAIALPAVNSSCNYLQFTTTGATASTATAPTPSSCGGSSPYIGGFSSSSHDVWFSVIAPANGQITIHAQLNYGISDGVMALYSGSCGALSQIACSDDHDYPGTTNDYKPFISKTGLTPGATYFIRYWGYGTNSGNSGLCVTSPINDFCSDALYICDLNGYSASTSSEFTIDRPGNMFGDGEYSDGTSSNLTNSGGVFGQGGAWGTGSNFNDVVIDNNSWIRFTAGATTAVLNVAVGDCYTNSGIQMQIFSGTNCTSFTPVSNFEENTTGFTITANGLTIGNDYYLMVDGYNGDICNYTITANSGVQFPDIIAAPATVCSGSSTTLTGPAGASSYQWLPGGATTSFINVTPSTTTTYTCIVSGVCGAKQTLTKTITVNQLPSMTSTASPAAICSGGTVSIPLTASPASSFTWIAANNANTAGESTANQFSSTLSNTITNSSTSSQVVTYTVTPTSTAGGCVGTQQIVNVTVNPKPSMNSANTATICSGTNVNISLSSNISSNYSWIATNNTNTTGESTTAQTSSTLNNTITNNSIVAQTITYTVTPTSTTGGCAGTQQIVNVTVNPAPIMTSTNTATICSGVAVNIPLTSNVASSYNWVATDNTNTTGESLTTQTSTTLNNTITNNSSSVQTLFYTVNPSSTTGSCAGTPQTITVTVNPAPTMTSANSKAICSGGTVSIPLTANIGSSFTWIASNNANTTGESITQQSTSNLSNTITNNSGVTQNVTYTITPTSTLGSCSGAQQIVTATIYTLPIISTAPTSSPSNCGLSTGALTGIVVNGNGSLNYSWTNSSNTIVGTFSNLNNQPAGTYNLTVTDANSCSSFFGPYSILNPGAPAAPIASAISNSVCVGGTISLSASSASPSPTYNWTGPNSNSNTSTLIIPSATLADNGTYAVTVTSAGCTGPSTLIPITVNPLPLANAASSPTTYCSGSTVNLFASGGTSYSWAGPNSFTSGIQNPTIISSTTTMSGTYTVTVTDGNNCINTANATVTINQTPSTPVTTANSSNLCEGDGLQLNASSDPGSTYSWSGPNGFSSSIQNPILSQTYISNSGNYLVIATLGTCNSSSASVNVNINANPIATASSTTTSICTGNTINLSGTGIGTPTWTGPNGFTSINANETIANATIAASGIYILLLTNAANCKDSATIAITVYQTPSAPITTANANNLCEGDSLQLNATSDPGSSFSWSGPNGFSSSNQNPIINPTSISNSGTYSVTAISGSCTSSSSLPMAISINANPIATASSTTTSICTGNTINLSGTGIGTPTWTGPNGFTSINANETITNATSAASGIYTLLLTNAANCKDSATIAITVYQTPSAPITTANANNLCEGDSLQLNANSDPGSSFSWSGPNGFSSSNQNPFINPTSTLNSGNYSVTAILGSCTSSSSLPMAITINANPIATANSTTTTICSGNTINLSSTGGGTYSWTGPNGFSSGNAIDSINTSTTAASGTYTLIVTNASGCKDTASVSILVNQSPSTPIVTANASNLCDGDSLQLNSNSTLGSTYAWSGPNGFSSSVQNPSIDPVTTVNSGSYTVIATLNNCASASAMVNITVNANPIATASSTTTLLCSGDTTYLSGTGGGNYNWTGPNSFSSSNANITILNTSISATGTYTLVVSDPSGCKDTATVNITVNQTPQPAITSDSATCTGAPLILSANGTGVINWYSDITLLNLIQANNSTYSPTIPSGSTATYYVTVSNNGCTSNAVAVNASNANINAAATASDTTGFVPMSVNFTNLSTGVDANDNFLWLFGDGSSATTFNANYTYNVGGNFNVMLIITETTTGCLDTAYINVVYDGDSYLIIPNIFTPNDDNTNDVYTIISKGLKTLDVELYDRWGLKMYEWHTIKGGWDGRTASGVQASDGTYFYIIKAKAYNTKEYLEKGSFQLTR